MRYSFTLLLLFATHKCVLQNKVYPVIRDVEDQPNHPRPILRNRDISNEGALTQDRIKINDRSVEEDVFLINEPIPDWDQHMGPVTPINVRRMVTLAARKKKQLKRRTRDMYAEETVYNNTMLGNDSTPLQYGNFRRNNPMKNEPLKWAHCVDLITPYINGIKVPDDTHIDYIMARDHDVQRLVHLIRINTTTYTAEEVLSVLMQISLIPIRLFHWDVSAMRFLLNAIIMVQGQQQSFRQLKNGLKELFNKWRLDVSNATNMLLHAKLFRPMCLKGPRTEASTKHSRHVRLGSSTTTTTEDECLQYDDEGYCVQRRHNL